MNIPVNPSLQILMSSSAVGQADWRPNICQELTGPIKLNLPSIKDQRQRPVQLQPVLVTVLAAVLPPGRRDKRLETDKLCSSRQVTQQLPAPGPSTETHMRCVGCGATCELQNCIIIIHTES